MKQKLKILVPVDFSSNSANALNYACGFAEKYPTQITILFVITGNCYLHVLPINERINPFDEERNRTIFLLKKWCEKILKEKKIKMKYCCMYGDMEEIIPSQIKKINPQMTIIGNTETGKTIGIFGNNTISVLENSEFPINADHLELA
jgi:nucleotide-binding universal stress UspA family protein